MTLKTKEDKNYGRRFVIPDIHGFPKTLQSLLNKLDLNTNDFIFFLGDYIDRGPSSAQVIDIILDLQNKGFKVFCIKGNHEDDFLEHFEFEIKNKNFRTKSKIQAFDLIENDEIIGRYEKFLNSLHDFIELDDFFLVHAGFNFEIEKPLKDRESMLRIRFMEPNTLGKTVIHGHNVTRLSIIQDKIRQSENIIPLDNGLYYSVAFKNFQENTEDIDVGNLVCLELNSMKLIRQESVD